MIANDKRTDLVAKNVDGETAADVARRVRRESLARLIEFIADKRRKNGVGEEWEWDYLWMMPVSELPTRLKSALRLTG